MEPAIDILSADAVGDGEMVAVRAGGWQLLVARQDDAYFAVNDRCPHAASRLSTGKLRKNVVICPRHGARFDLASGLCLGAPYPALRRFPVEVRDGRLFVSLPATPPGISDIPIG